jgi:replicative DNA helicase
MHPELELISNIVETEDFSTVKRLGVTKDLFTMRSAKEAFSWLWDEYHNPKQRGEIPSKNRLLRKFPDFDYSPSRNSLSALVSDIQTLRAQVDLNLLAEELSQNLLDDEDPAMILETLIPRMRDLKVRTSDDNGISLLDGASILRQEYGTKKMAGGITGIPYPWSLMNGPTGGMQNEEFIVIYGRPGNMKTWLACVIAAHAWISNYRVMFFSKEISSTAILRRITSIIAGVDYGKLTTGNLSVQDEEIFFDLLEALPDIEEEEEVNSHRRAIYCISDKGKRTSSTVDDIIAVAESFQPDLVVVDGFYLMRDGRSGQRTADWKQIAHISQDLKGMAQYLECPVVGTTQANRANAKNPSGDLDDLSFADAIGMDADLAVRAFRGPNPSGKGASIMLVPSKVREAVIRPFVINAIPSIDWSVLEKSVNIKQFLETKQRMEMAEDQQMSGGASEKKASPPKPKKRKDPFRT